MLSMHHFVFKQKTAYEMRISDWSSDVCSSDLIGDLQRGMALAAPDTLAASEWLTLSIRAVDAAPPLKNGRRLKALLGTAEIDVRLRLLDRDVLEAGQRGYAQLHCTQRSEEHTSELQSLMRITYAVFCLKQKNRTKTR